MAQATDGNSGVSMECVPSGDGSASIACHLMQPSAPTVGLVLLIHGRDGAGRAPHMAAIADAYLARGWRVAAPDLPRSRATPGSGPPETITLGIHLREAEAVLEWVRSSFGEEGQRLALAGHSLGGYAVARLGARSDDLDHILAVSPALSGAALLAARRAMGQPAIEALRREAPAMFAEMEGHDAVPSLRRIAIPLAVVTGARDGLTPPLAARTYFESAPGGCFYTALPGQHHCPSGPAYAQALEAALDALGA